MFFLDIRSPDIAAARDNHYQKFRCYIRRKVGLSSCSDTNCSICKSALGSILTLSDPVDEFLCSEANIKTILTGTPAELLNANDQFWKMAFPQFNIATWQPYFDEKNKKGTSALNVQTREVFKYIDELNDILNYHWFIDKKNAHYNAYTLSRKLDRNTCTYCNRSYTSTVIKERTGAQIIRPTLDHWFTKSVFPLLAVSFQNLIPSCYSCNSSVKGTNTLNLIDHVHPYVDAGQNEAFQFGYVYHASLNKYRIFIKDAPGTDSKARKTLQSMFVDEIYNTHVSELADLLLLKKSYSDSYIRSMRKLLNGGLSTPEVYRLLFGIHFDKTDFHKRPLSKFKYDILRQIGMLKDL